VEIPCAVAIAIAAAMQIICLDFCPFLGGREKRDAAFGVVFNKGYCGKLVNSGQFLGTRGDWNA